MLSLNRNLRDIVVLGVFACSIVKRYRLCFYKDFVEKNCMCDSYVRGFFRVNLGLDLRANFGYFKTILTIVIGYLFERKVWDYECLYVTLAKFIT